MVIELNDIVIPPGLRKIGYHAFNRCSLEEVQVSDGVQSIGCYAFYWCDFTKLRSPPLVTTIPRGMLCNCQSLFSLEVPANIIQVEGNAFSYCHSLRNVALVMNTAVEGQAFQNCLDLLHIFGTEEAIVNALQNRFYGLLIHSRVYF